MQPRPATPATPTPKPRAGSRPLAATPRHARTLRAETTAPARMRRVSRRTSQTATRPHSATPTRVMAATPAATPVATRPEPQAAAVVVATAALAAATVPATALVVLAAVR